MTYEVVWHERIADDLGSIPKRNAIRIIERVRTKLSADPAGAGKPLKGRFQGLFSFRIGRFRVIYVVDHAEKRVRVLNVKDRKDVYR